MQDEEKVVCVCVCAGVHVCCADTVRSHVRMFCLFPILIFSLLLFLILCVCVFPIPTSLFSFSYSFFPPILGVHVLIFFSPSFVCDNIVRLF